MKGHILYQAVTAVLKLKGLLQTQGVVTGEWKQKHIAIMGMN